jgi:hypothetical protein
MIDEQVAIKRRVAHERRIRDNILLEMGISPYNEMSMVTVLSSNSNSSSSKCSRSKLLSSSSTTNSTTRLVGDVIKTHCLNEEDPESSFLGQEETERELELDDDDDDDDLLTPWYPEQQQQQQQQQPNSTEQQRINTNNTKQSRRKQMEMMALLAVMIVIVAILTCVTLLTRKTKQNLSSSSSSTPCLLDRKQLVKCTSASLEIPSCAMETFEQLISTFSPTLYKHSFTNLSLYPCDAQHFGLLATAIAKMNMSQVNSDKDSNLHNDKDNHDLLQYWILATLYFSLGGPNWDKDQNWLSTDHGISVCQEDTSWYGITCSENLYVHSIELMLNNLVGSIPTEIALLSSLRILNLNGGELSGTIPTEIGTMTNLTKVLLESTQINGTIPSELGSCPKLTDINFMGVNLTGSIPTEIGRLSLLGMSQNGCIIIIIIQNNSS